MTQDTIFDGSKTNNGQEKAENQDSENNSSVVARYRLSPLTLTVFKREAENGSVFYNCQLQRVYTQDDGESFEYTDSLRPRDLRKASRLLSRAADEIQGLNVEVEA